MSFGGIHLRVILQWVAKLLFCISRCRLKMIGPFISGARCSSHIDSMGWAKLRCPIQIIHSSIVSTQNMLLLEMSRWERAAVTYENICNITVTSYGRDGVSNYQPHDCLLNRLFRRRSTKTLSSASLAFVRGIHRWPVNSPHNGPVTRKMFPFDDVIMNIVRNLEMNIGFGSNPKNGITSFQIALTSLIM